MKLGPGPLRPSRPLIAGLAWWTVTSSGNRWVTPWENPVYWTFPYPVGVVACGLLGFAFPVRAWQTALVLMLSQAVLMGANTTDIRESWPAFAILAASSLPAVGLAMAGAWLRGRLDARAQRTP